MKKILTLLTLLLATFCLFAQADIVPVGGDVTTFNGSLSYTVGQIAVQKTSNGDKSALEGVQQPYEIQTVGVDNYQGISLEAVVYPNPTPSMLKVRISNYEIPDGGLIAQLYDANGRLLSYFAINDLESSINMEQYPTATYQLRIQDGQRVLKTFKIVKQNQ